MQNKIKVCFICSNKQYLANFDNLFEKEEKSSLEIYPVYQNCESLNFNLFKIYEQAKELILSENISAVLAPEEILHLVSAVLEQTAIRKVSFDFTKVRAEFFCDHKYYTRKYLDINTCPYSYLLCDENITNEAILVAVQEAGGFPVYLKPFFGYNCMLQKKANNVQDVIEHIKKVEKDIPPFFSDGIFEFFERFVDLDRYPLFVKKGIIIEKYIEYQINCCIENCIVNNNFYQIAIVDMKFNKEENMFEFIYVPSLLPEEIIKELTENNKKIVENMMDYGINNAHFNIEFMITKENKAVLQECNGRIYDDAYYLMKKAAKNGNFYLNLIKMQLNEKVEMPIVNDKVITAFILFYTNRKQIEKINYENFEKYGVNPYFSKGELPEFGYLMKKIVFADKVDFFTSYDEIVKDYEFLKEKLLENKISN